jgi:hypothetical protein
MLGFQTFPTTIEGGTMKRIIILGCAILSGCMVPPTQQYPIISSPAVIQPIVAAEKECAVSSKKARSSERDLIACKFDNIERILGSSGFEYHDLLDQWRSESLKVAGRFDTKEINERKASELYAAAVGRFNSNVNSRDMVHGQQHQYNVNAMTNAAQAMQRSLPPPRQNVNCSGMNNNGMVTMSCY